jgi:uncharacterized MAPEG superfamily protein
MTIAYACVLLMGLFPYVAAGIAKKGFKDFDNRMPRQWLAQQTGFRVDLLAIGFVLARIAFLVCYLANWPTSRTIVWTIGLACVVGIFFQI